MIIKFTVEGSLLSYICGNFLIALIPPSERTPNLVNIKKDYRFYCCLDSENIMNPEGDVSMYKWLN